MASGFFALLDDIATLMDDVATFAKISTKKTAGILGDDLAVNADKASGFVSSRELPVLWAIMKRSFLNKLIILPIAFVLSAFVPLAITIILVLGGLYLAYEGAEKIVHYVKPHPKHEMADLSVTPEKESVLEQEKQKIKAAIMTDFILSVEIVIIALGSVMEQPLLTQILVVSIVAIIATVGVYGIVALIVRMDDLGLRLINFNTEEDSFSDRLGRFMVNALPKVVKALSVIGTLALLLVSGGIFLHYVPILHDFLPSLLDILREFILGLLVGLAVVSVITVGKKILKK